VATWRSAVFSAFDLPGVGSEMIGNATPAAEALRRATSQVPSVDPLSPRITQTGPAESVRLIAAIVSPIPRSSLHAAMMIVNAVVGEATCSGGCRSSRSETARNATMAPGRYATRMTIVQARAEPVTGARSPTQQPEIHTESQTHASV
jgi:hypothetical protein